MAFLQIPPPACPCLEEGSQPKKENKNYLLPLLLEIFTAMKIVELGME
jgi:hypothetical protein